MNEHKKTNCIGPGGVKCSCCVPIPHHKKQLKKFLNRRARRSFKRSDSSPTLDEEFGGANCDQ